MSETIIEKNGALIVRLDGDVDLDHAPAVRRTLLDCVEKKKPLVVDMTDVDYIDSSGIASLVEAFQGCNRTGTAFSLAAVSPQALRVIELARLDKVFAIHANADAAIAAAS